MEVVSLCPMGVQQRALHAVVLKRCLLREGMQMNGVSNDCYFYSIANKSSTTPCNKSFCSKLTILYEVPDNKCTCRLPWWPRG